ncbi:hypothetical protein GK047_27740 [Paenibacillus sp. SYP-B3998]|uniref:Uncharacterized protein n=1 Tax=Paenibacillus sp. SYP-B3998 TaxID=2678564 RepID=A0A6G4A7E0_9BACL|nr:hypothetical protein [Paenibacillus sp. SYP-B3998]NEW09719.1 hypothetical protein [Paenibacillus sp. SYP-B3998]
MSNRVFSERVVNIEELQRNIVPVIKGRTFIRAKLSKANRYSKTRRWGLSGHNLTTLAASPCPLTAPYMRVNAYSGSKKVKLQLISQGSLPRVRHHAGRLLGYTKDAKLRSLAYSRNLKVRD